MKEKDKLIRKIAAFALPYLLSCLLQTLYGMADLFIIGQFEGAASTTAVSIGSQVMHMITVIIVGLSMGTTVSIGQAKGAGDSRKISKITGNTVSVFLIFSFILTALLLLLAGPIVSLLSTPAEAASGTKSYLYVCFAGIPFITAYNVISSIFRGHGNSRSPMFFVAIACVINIVLDVIFMGPLHMGPVGAAFGTVISQTASVIISLIFMLKKKVVVIEKGDIKPEREVVRKILGIGVPVALQDGFIQVFFIVITIIANGRGLTDAAAVGIVEKIIGFLFMVPSAMLSTVSALGAQYVGAGEKKTAEKILGIAILISCSFGLIVAIVVQFVAEGIVGLFTSDASVVIAGGQYFRSYVWDCFIAGTHFSCSGYFCAIGKSGLSFLHNVISIITVRVPGAILMSAMFADTLFPMGMASTAGSFISGIVCLIAFIILKRKDRARGFTLQ